MTDARYDSLTDEEALRVLYLVLDRERFLPDQDDLEMLDAQLREAAQQPLAIEDDSIDSTETAQQAIPAEMARYDPTAAGALARETLTYLVTERPDLTSVIDRAITMAKPDPFGSQERIEPLTIGIGALVVLALQTDVKIERGTTGKWRFKVHKKAMSDTALGTLIAKVIGVYSKGPVG